MEANVINKTQEVQLTRRALDDALKYTDYSCKLVSWDDVSRAHTDSLSVIGPNITDTYLRAADGSSLYTVRSSNWNEKLGMVSASDITLLNGNCDGKKDGSLSSITLDKFLAKPYENGAQYAVLTGNLQKLHLDAKVSIRFQTVFLPLGDDGRGIQFASESYNYQTSSEDNPRNLILLATTQGLSVQAGTAGKKRLLLHQGKPGDVKAYWMKAEASRHKVGTEQKDTTEEREDALARGSATSESFGIKAMGERFNALMTIQVPLLQKVLQNEPADTPMLLAASASDPDSGLERNGQKKPRKRARIPRIVPATDLMFQSLVSHRTQFARRPSNSIAVIRPPPRPHTPPKVGTASAARLSRGDFVENVNPLTLDGDAVRHPDEHVTVTVVLYHAVKDGVPSAEDALAAVDELERMYSSCNTSGKLAEAKFNSLKFGVVDPLPTAGLPGPSNAIDSSKSIDIVMSKMNEFATAQNEKFMEMKLVTLGAINDEAAKETIEMKLDTIKSQLDEGKSIEEAAIDELKLLVKGSLSI